MSNLNNTMFHNLIYNDLLFFYLNNIYINTYDINNKIKLQYKINKFKTKRYKRDKNYR